MEVILIILALMYISSKRDKKKKRHTRRYSFGKSDWEKTCDDGGKFFGW